MAIDYAERLEKTLNEAGISTTKPAVAVDRPSGPRRIEPDRVTFSTMLTALQELQKRLDESLQKANIVAARLAGGANSESIQGVNATLPPDEMPAFERLAYETMGLARQVAALEQALDRALGALQ